MRSYGKTKVQCLHSECYITGESYKTFVLGEYGIGADGLVPFGATVTKVTEKNIKSKDLLKFITKNLGEPYFSVRT